MASTYDSASILGLMPAAKAFTAASQNIDHFDIIGLVTFLWLTGWYTNCLSLTSPKVDPLLYIPVHEKPKEGTLLRPARNIAEAFKDKDIIVLWGSQNGRAESLAMSFARQCASSFGLKATAIDIDDHDFDRLDHVPENKLVVFVMATFGQGDPTDNAVKFFTLLTRLAEKAFKPNSLQNLHYAAFGLGNRTYKHYNKVIEVVDGCLAEAGAQRVGPLGRADESKGNMSTREDFDEWKDAMLDHVSDFFKVDYKDQGLDSSVEVIDTVASEDCLCLGEHTTQEKSVDSSFISSLTIAKDLESGPDSTRVYLEFDLTSQPSAKYQAGDHLAVQPMNPDVEVDRLCRLLGFDDSKMNRPIAINSKQGRSLAVPSPSTRATALRHYLDICGPVSRDLLRAMLACCPTQEGRTKMTTLIRDRKLFRTEVSDKCLNIGEVMELVSGASQWADLTFNMLVEYLDRLRPRSYSIASTPLVSARKVSIACSVTSKHLAGGKVLNGVTSNYLSALVLAQQHQSSESKDHISYDLAGPRKSLANGKAVIHIRRSAFKLPASITRPVIMVAAGTGVAPFRGFVQERAAMAARGVTVGPMLLLFGCRSTTDGYFFREEWPALQSQLPDFTIKTAFSRPSDEAEKAHVQDLLVQATKQVSELLNQDAAFYICGSSDMAREIRQRLIKIMASTHGWTEEHAEAFVVKDMKEAKLLQEDVWTG